MPDEPLELPLPELLPDDAVEPLAVAPELPEPVAVLDPLDPVEPDEVTLVPLEPVEAAPELELFELLDPPMSRTV